MSQDGNDADRGLDLLQRAARFKSLMNTSLVGIFFADVAGNFLYVNRQWCEITGLSEAEALDRGLAWTLSPEDQAHTLSQWCDAAESGTPFQSEFRIQNTSGDSRWVYCQVVAEKSTAGVVVGYVGTTTDITERKLIEDQLRERKEFIETVMDNLPIGLAYGGCQQPEVDIEQLSAVEVDQLFPFHYMNNRLEEILGWPKETFRTVNDFWERLLPDPQYRREIQEQNLADHQVGNKSDLVWEFQAEHRNGRKIDLIVREIPLPEQNTWIATIQDITDRKQAERSALERNEFIETVMDNLPIGLAVIDQTEGAIVYLNEKLEEVLGWPKEVLVNEEEFWENCFPDPVFREQERQRQQADAASGDPKRMVWDFPITRQSGEIANILTVDIPMFERNMVITTLQDITELKRAEALQTQLHMAAEIQAKLLPDKAPDLEGFQLAARCLPAYHVGGDFYDWHRISDERVTLTLGDVMGKGMPAAMLMADVRAALRAVSQQNSPAAAMRLAEQALADDLEKSESFVTLFHAQLDIKSGCLSYVDFGHGHVFVRRKDGAVEEFSSGSVPLGVIVPQDCRQEELFLQAGDALVLYSDGLVDALPEQELTCQDFAEQLTGIETAQEMVDRLIAMVDNQSQQPDDLTVLVVYCEKSTV